MTLDSAELEQIKYFVQTTQGSEPTPGEVIRERGSSRTGRDVELVPELATRSQALRTYAKMANENASVDVSLRSAKVPVLGADYFVEPFDEKQENQDIAEFCAFNLLEGTNEPWLLTLENVLRMYEDGSSVFETVWEEAEWAPKRSGANRRKYTMLRKLAFRPAATVTEFLYDDNGGPAGVKHNALRADNSVEEVKIDIEKLVIFVFNKNGGNLEGKSLLRTAHPNWYYMRELHKIDAIQKERHALGVPVAKLTQGFTADTVTAAWEMVTNIRTNEDSGAVLPPGVELEFITPSSNQVDVIPSIEHHNGQIMLNTLVEFLLLGLTGGGGRATSGSQLDMFQKSLKYVANMICEHINLYIFPKMVRYNFKTNQFPRLRVRNIGEASDLQKLASALSSMVSEGIITMDEPTEQWARQVFDVPFKKEPRPALILPGDPAFGNDGGKNGSRATQQTGNSNTGPGFEATK